ncbi:MAG: Txe/YoeB family addiction module toxin [Coriobacteriales bacterium]|nr:Txe/YoeB family addiction module toxin [Coriobacteriales bacterium]
MYLSWSDDAWDSYQYWLANDKRIVKRINTLIKDIQRGGHTGIGKPEPLKYDLEGYWSRRITDEHRLIYTIEGKNIIIAQCRGHYQ